MKKLASRIVWALSLIIILNGCQNAPENIDDSSLSEITQRMVNEWQTEEYSTFEMYYDKDYIIQKEVVAAKKLWKKWIKNPDLEFTASSPLSIPGDAEEFLADELSFQFSVVNYLNKYKQENCRYIFLKSEEDKMIIFWGYKSGSWKCLNAPFSINDHQLEVLVGLFEPL